MFDFEQPKTIKNIFEKVAPSLVINAAAWTDVDRAETEPDAAMRANRDGPAILSALAEQSGVPFIHISTDYVFDGAKGSPYLECDRTRPIGVYGHSKRLGELKVLELCSKGIILRTSWVYSPFGKNFALTMLKAAKKQDCLRVVEDQIGCPTEAGDLAEAILSITKSISCGWSERYAGIFHVAGSGHTSWFGFASAILTRAHQTGWNLPNNKGLANSYRTPSR